MGKTPKQKERSKKTVKNELDRVFSLFIRKRDCIKGNIGDFIYCISCGGIVPFDEADAGHYAHRGNMSTRWMEKNVNAQCRRCNRFMGGNLDGYALGLIKKYGDNILWEINAQKQKPKNWTVKEMEALIVVYKHKLNKLNEI
jgi:hypothetical protein